MFSFYKLPDYHPIYDTCILFFCVSVGIIIGT